MSEPEPSRAAGRRSGGNNSREQHMCLGSGFLLRRSAKPSGMRVPVFVCEAESAEEAAIWGPVL
jgi:hypothetical protein